MAHHPTRRFCRAIRASKVCGQLHQTKGRVKDFFGSVTETTRSRSPTCTSAAALTMPDYTAQRVSVAFVYRNGIPELNSSDNGCAGSTGTTGRAVLGLLVFETSTFAQIPCAIPFASR